MTVKSEKGIKIKAASLNLDNEYNALVLGFFEKKLELDGKVKEIDEKFGNIIQACIKNGNFNGEKNEIKSLYVNEINIKFIILLGLGEQEKHKLESFNSLIGDVSRKLRDSGVKKFALLLKTFAAREITEEKIAGNAVISALLGSYRFDNYRTKDLEKIKNLSEIILISDAKLDKIMENSVITANAITKTRDLINTPPNVANPEYMADYAGKIAKNSGLECTVFGKEDIEKLGMNCFLAVASGSKNEPRLVVLEYYGAPKEQHPLVLVGKGITFDSGGLNIKPYPNMTAMKCDKSGAVTAFHVIEACASMKLPVNLVCITPFCENMPSGISYRPDDVIKAFNGITVEVKNTDAEGRMILADALAYAGKYKPKAIIDIATLTGASLIVLGNVGTPIMGNDEKLISAIKDSSSQSLEKVWELPLWEEYDELLKSDIADVKHLNEEGGAGVIIGAIFLKNFINNTSWAHLDIGSTAWSKNESGILTKGATGSTVRLLIETMVKFSST